MKLSTPPPTRRRLTAAHGSDCAAAQHGTRYAVDRHGCSCPDAQREKFRANKRSNMRRRDGAPPARVDATGTTRRMQAMNADGYSSAYLARELGCAPSRAVHLIAGIYQSVHEATAARVAELFDALRDTSARDNPAVTETTRPESITIVENRAVDKGYVRAERWDARDIDDPVAEPVADGPTADTVRDLIALGMPEQEIRATYHEIPCGDRAAVVDDLTTRGRTAGEIGDLLDVATRTVERHRSTAAAARTPAPPPTRPAPEQTRPIEQEGTGVGFAPPCPGEECTTTVTDGTRTNDTGEATLSEPCLTNWAEQRDECDTVLSPPRGTDTGRTPDDAAAQAGPGDGLLGQGASPTAEHVGEASTADLIEDARQAVDDRAADELAYEGTASWRTNEGDGGRDQVADTAGADNIDRARDRAA